MRFNYYWIQNAICKHATARWFKNSDFIDSTIGKTQNL